MNIMQVVPRVQDQSSGPSYSVTRLCDSLQEAGQNVELHVLSPRPVDTQTYTVHEYDCSHFPGARRLGWSPNMKRELDHAAKQADIVHNHSMWMMPNIYSHQAAKKAGCRFVFSPRGTLSEWALNRSRLRKKLVWWYGQKAALYGADCLHATSEKEFEEIRSNGLLQPVAIISNGVDIPDIVDTLPVESSINTLLFLSRIHPAKNVDLLLRCWKLLEDSFRDWELVIAGPLDNEYAKKTQWLAARLELKRARFTGEMTGLKKKEALAQAALFVLPTNTENFGIAVAEALAHGTPVIVTKGAPWSGVESHDCGWWIEQGEESLQAALSEAMRLSQQQLAAMGQRGRMWMERDYSWNRMGEMMLLTYRWLLSDSSRPDWVETGSR